MATRFYFRENGSAPITPAIDAGWDEAPAPFDRGPMFTTSSGGDTLTNVSGFATTTGHDGIHRQWISEPMAAGHTFNTGVAYKCYVQCIESNIDDGISPRVGIRILSQDGTTVRHTVKAVASYAGSVFATTLTNRAFLDIDTGDGSYTTVAGDRLVVELGHGSTVGTSPSGTTRWGSAGSSDLPENQTSTSTTERPWFETSLNLTFPEVFSQSVDADVSVAATMTRVASFLRTITAGATTVAATMTRGSGVSRTIAATTTVTATMGRGTGFTRLVNATVTIAATLARANLFTRTLSAVTTLSSTLNTPFSILPRIAPRAPTSLSFTPVSSTSISITPQPPDAPYIDPL